jgi:G3E family GTPase
MIIHGVQHIFHPPFVLPEWPSEDRRTRIVFIARNIEEETLRETLEVFRSAAGLLETPSANF